MAQATSFSAPARRSWVARMWGGWARSRTWLAIVHHIWHLVFGVLWFSLVVTLVATAGGLAITFIGLPLLVVTLLGARVLSAVERWRAKVFVGAPTASPFGTVRRGGWWPTMKGVLADKAAWKALAFGVVLLPWSIVTFTVTVTLVSLTLGLVLAPAWLWPVGETVGVQLWGHTASTTELIVMTVAYVAVGLLLMPVVPVVERWMASVDRSLVRSLLAPSREDALRERVGQLEVSRDASLGASAAELRRIERDLHDGAQQRLVSLAMSLGMARERLEGGADPARAAELVAEAHDESKLAIAELRQLVRGIHPAVLTDRGLDAALSAVAARSPVPVELDVQLPQRPPAAVEAAAYFVVVEALNNVAKHARATNAEVRVRLRDGRLVVEVTDDGVGGAVVAPTGGLAGLRDRVTAVEGSLRIASPIGGPTTVRAELPCGS